MTLNAKQETFIAEYLKSRNATEAYVTAYNPKNLKGAESNASRLIRNDKITQRINEALARIAKEAEETVEKQLRDLAEIKKRCMQKEQVLDDEGRPTGEWTFDSRGALRAIELIGKHLGMWEKQPTPPDPPGDTLNRLEIDRQATVMMILESRRRKDSNHALQIESPTKVHVQPAPADSQAVRQGDAELSEFAGLQLPPKPKS